MEYFVKVQVTKNVDELINFEECKYHIKNWKETPIF